MTRFRAAVGTKISIPVSVVMLRHMPIRAHSHPILNGLSIMLKVRRFLPTGRHLVGSMMPTSIYHSIPKSPNVYGMHRLGNGKSSYKIGCLERRSRTMPTS